MRGREGETVANSVVHFEINGPDKSALQQFYTDAFEWSVNADNPMGYGLVEHDEARARARSVDEFEMLLRHARSS